MLTPIFSTKKVNGALQPDVDWSFQSCVKQTSVVYSADESLCVFILTPIDDVAELFLVEAIQLNEVKQAQLDDERFPELRKRYEGIEVVQNVGMV